MKMNVRKGVKSAASMAMALVLIILTSCDQTEGYGGTSTIKGKIETMYYNSDYSILVRQEPAVDEEVFLLFGENEVVGDKVESSATGAFEFSYLNPGTYKLYYTSEDSSRYNDSEYPVIVDIQLTEGEDLDLGTLQKIETLDFDDGSAKIYGVIQLINYKNTSEYPFLEVKDTSFAQEQEVYLIYNNHNYYDERIRTSYNGYFEFGNLIPGEYEVFTYSEDVQGGTEDITISKTITITEENQEVDLGVIFIEQL